MCVPIFLFPDLTTLVHVHSTFFCVYNFRPKNYFSAFLTVFGNSARQFLLKITLIYSSREVLTIYTSQAYIHYNMFSVVEFLPWKCPFFGENPPLSKGRFYDIFGVFLDDLQSYFLWKKFQLDLPLFLRKFIVLQGSK